MLTVLLDSNSHPSPSQSFLGRSKLRAVRPGVELHRVVELDVVVGGMEVKKEPMHPAGPMQRTWNLAERLAISFRLAPQLLCSHSIVKSGFFKTNARKCQKPEPLPFLQLLKSFLDAVFPPSLLTSLNIRSIAVRTLGAAGGSASSERHLWRVLCSGGERGPCGGAGCGEMSCAEMGCAMTRGLDGYGAYTDESNGAGENDGALCESKPCSKSCLK